MDLEKELEMNKDRSSWN